VATERAPEEPKHYQVQRIREALAHDPRVSELELQVTVRGNKVFIAGSIPTEDRRAAVADVVREAEPDLEVHNQTKVGVVPGEVEEETLS
jgi:osmotically-inducible protein OsmY